MALEARRITGPHLLLDRPGAVIELTGEAHEVVARTIEGLQRLGWSGVPVIRTHAGGTSVGIEAPPDLLYTACALLEWAAGSSWAEVEKERLGEENPRLRELLEHKAGPVFSDDDFGFTLGLGRFSKTWPLDDLPDPASLPGGEGIPLVFITGTNGKTTTTRMLTRIALAAGSSPGWTSSDAWGVGLAIEERGDWTGPGAARNVLRHSEVDFAILETARGGLLRRGLVIGGAQVAVVTNVASDHLGEWGVYDVADMARAKLGVALGLREGGVLVVNRGCVPLRDAVPELLERRPDLRVIWFEDDGGQSFALESGEIHWSEVPMTYGGTARHNVENAMAASLAAEAAGLSFESIRHGLAGFRPTAESSYGRMNRFTLPNGATALVDFGHNPHGVAQVGKTAARWPAERRILLIGQAGDRTDQDMAELTAVIAEFAPDEVVIKGLHKYLRGRERGEVVSLLRKGLLRAGYPEDQIRMVDDERQGVASMLEGSQNGDLLILLIHDSPGGAYEMLGECGARPA